MKNVSISLLPHLVLGDAVPRRGSRNNMSTISLRVPEEELNIIKSYAKINNKSLSAVIRSIDQSVAGNLKRVPLINGRLFRGHLCCLPAGGTLFRRAHSCGLFQRPPKKTDFPDLASGPAPGFSALQECRRHTALPGGDGHAVSAGTGSADLAHGVGDRSGAPGRCLLILLMGIVLMDFPGKFRQIGRAHV